MATSHSAVAERDGCDSLEVFYESDESCSREHLALLLLIEAQKVHPLIPDGRRGVNHEERLGEYRYKIVSTTSTLIS